MSDYREFQNKEAGCRKPHDGWSPGDFERGQTSLGDFITAKESKMTVIIRKPARRLALAAAIVVALSVTGTVVYRTHGQPQQLDVYQLAFTDQLSNCGNDAECWKLEATRMQQVAHYYKTHAKGLNDLYLQEQKQGLEKDGALHKCATHLPSSAK